MSPTKNLATFFKYVHSEMGRCICSTKVYGHEREMRFKKKVCSLNIL